MSRFSLPITRLIHENLSIIMCFAYSQRPLENMVNVDFRGEWKYLNKTLFDISYLSPVTFRLQSCRAGSPNPAVRVVFKLLWRGSATPPYKIQISRATGISCAR